MLGLEWFGLALATVIGAAWGCGGGGSSVSPSGSTCTYQKCALNCLGGQSGQACIDCVDAKCQPAFDTCSGL